MAINKKTPDVDVLSGWNTFLQREQLNIPEMQVSALCSWVKDCEDSFKEIYSNLMIEVAKTAEDDYETLHDCVTDIYWQLDHIKKHIIDAEDGFRALMKILASKMKDVPDIPR